MYWFIFAGALGSTDLGIKYYINKNKKEDDKEDICKGKISLTKSHNKGALFGILKEKANLLLSLSLICIGTIIGMLLLLIGRRGNTLLKIGLSMMLGGAGSNIYERYTKGQVTDYIQFNLGCKKLRQMIFNIGDFLILIGALATAIGSLRKK